LTAPALWWGMVTVVFDTNALVAAQGVQFCVLACVAS
jgi:hypothetical protein